MIILDNEPQRIFIQKVGTPIKEDHTSIFRLRFDSEPGSVTYDESYSYSMIPLSGVARADLSHQVMGNQHTPPYILASMGSYCTDLAQSTIINFPSGEQLKHTVSWHPAKKLGRNLQP
jgi:hypothetical protein